MKFASSAFLVLTVFVLLFGCAGSGPAAPSGVTAKGVPQGVQVSWSASAANNVIGYNIYRSNAAGQLGGKLNTAPVNDLSFTDSDVQDGHTYYYTVKAVDSNNAEGAGSAQVQFIAQLKPPSGLSISINNGSQFTTSTSVSLALSATGASQCQFSNDASAWGPWQNYAQSAQWTLATGGDGQRTVYMECRNSAGVVSQTASSSIVLKTTGPTITMISPRQGDVLPVRFSLSFTVANAMGEATCNANADGAVIPIGAVAENEDNTLTVLLADGGHELYVQCTDQVGTSQSPTVEFETEENPVKLTINDGSGHTTTTAVNLNVFAQDAARCRFSNDGSSFGAWMPFNPVTPWTLASGNGVKTVYADCQNSNNVSLGVANDSITLDNNPPSISLTINNGDAVTYSRTVKLYVFASGSVTQCRFSGDAGSTYGDWQAYASVNWYVLAPVNGMHQVVTQCKNAAGSQGTASANIFLQLAPPQPPTGLSILINGGSSRTTSRSVILTLVARFADTCRYQNEIGSWSDWESYTTSRSWTLSDGQGQKAVSYQCMNQYGMSGLSQAQIYYGPERPATVSVSAPVQGQLYDSDSISITFTPDGGFSPFSCTYYCNGVPRDAGSVASGATVSRTLAYVGMNMQTECGVPAGSQFSTYVTCVDARGSSAQSQTVTFMWSKWVGPLT
ncbi:Uncharacterised protein [uncultured archaeon]|nr:Uncharacterised protein [uncultured archaeon]